MEASYTSLQTYYRLRAGYHLFAKNEKNWYLYTPEQRFILIHAPYEQIARIAALLTHTIPYQDVISDPALLSLLRHFEQHQYLEQDEHATVQREARRDLTESTIVIYGQNPIASAVSSLLQNNGIGQITHVTEHTPFAMADLIITCAGWLPDRQWIELDTWCAAQNIAWHRCHREGQNYYIGPLTIPHQTVSYADERARRLGATDFPLELLAYWRYLNQGEGVPPVSWPDSGGVAIIAGIIVTEALAYLRDRSSVGRNEQYALDLATLTLEHHPILPVPQGVMQEVIP